jgi:hypothetical protein
MLRAGAAGIVLAEHRPGGTDTAAGKALMKERARPIRGRKLLVASLGVGTLTFAACAVFPGCNLLPPPPCSQDPAQPWCQDLATTDTASDGDTGAGSDGGASIPGDGGDGGASDGSHD